jgi:hypothetical protein
MRIFSTLLIAAYIVKNFGDRNVEVFTELKVGKSIIGKDRKLDVLVVCGDRAIAIECKSQNVEGTTDEKIPYSLNDLEAMRIPGVLVYAGEGFSDGIVQMLRAHPLAAFCDPDPDTLERDPERTLELDVILAQTFSWWDLVKVESRRFDLAEWNKERAAGENPKKKKG